MVILDRTEGLNHIFFLVFIARMHEIVRETTIICEEYETGGFLIEATDRENPFWYIDDIEESCLTMSDTGTHDPIRLIHLIVDEFFHILHDGVSNPDFILLGIDDLPDMSRSTIDGNLPFSDVLFRLPARANASMGEVFLELHNSKYT
jgi:hypothetical protein